MQLLHCTRIKLESCVAVNLYIETLSYVLNVSATEKRFEFLSFAYRTLPWEYSLLRKSNFVLLDLLSRDEGNILIKVDLSLKGDSISAIFDNLFLSTTKALKIFLKTYPNIQPLVQEKTNIKTLKRRNFEDSEITKDEFSEMSLLEIYNKIRCLTDPYPNAFLEDEHGNRLFFEGISYERNEKNQ